MSCSAFEIRVHFELQNLTTILELKTTYTNIQGFFFASDFFGVVVDGGCMCLWSCKINSFANLFLLFGMWGCGMSGGSEDAHSVMGQDLLKI